MIEKTKIKKILSICFDAIWFTMSILFGMCTGVTILLLGIIAMFNSLFYILNNNVHIPILIILMGIFGVFGLAIFFSVRVSQYFWNVYNRPYYKIRDREIKRIREVDSNEKNK